MKLLHKPITIPKNLSASSYTAATNAEKPEINEGQRKSWDVMQIAYKRKEL